MARQCAAAFWVQVLALETPATSHGVAHPSGKTLMPFQARNLRIQHCGSAQELRACQEKQPDGNSVLLTMYCSSCTYLHCLSDFNSLERVQLALRNEQAKPRAVWCPAHVSRVLAAECMLPAGKQPQKCYREPQVRVDKQRTFDYKLWKKAEQYDEYPNGLGA